MTSIGHIGFIYKMFCSVLYCRVYNYFISKYNNMIETEIFLPLLDISNLLTDTISTEVQKCHTLCLLTNITY